MGNVTIHHPKVSPAIGGLTGVSPTVPGVIADERSGFANRSALRLLYAPVSTIGISNTWSIAFTWSVASLGSTYTLIDIGNTTDDTNRIRVNMAGAVASDPLIVYLYDSADALFKEYSFNGVAYALAGEEFTHHTVITWDGTTLLMYSDGKLFAATGAATDNAGTMTDTERRLSLGSTTAGAQILDGQHHTLALWNSVLTAHEVACIYQAGHFPRVDLKNTIKDYTSASSLVHWWTVAEVFDLNGTLMKYPDQAGDLPLGGDNTGSTYSTTDILALQTTQGSYIARTYIDLTVSRALAAPATTIGVDNNWTLAGLCRRVSTVGVTWTIAVIAPTATNVNEIRVEVLGGTTNEPWNIVIYDSSGVIIKQYQYELVDTYLNDAIGLFWVFWAVTWDGTDLSFYRNGVKMTPLVKTTDSTGTQTDTARQVSFSIPKTLSGATYRCNAAEWMMWDVALSGTEIERLWDGGNIGVDYAEDTLGYYSAHHLKHWWRPGQPPRSIGTTAAIPGLVTDEVASGGIDISDSAVGTPTLTHIRSTGDMGPGGSLYCYSPQYKRSLKAPAGNLLGIANNWTIGYWHYVVAVPGTGVEQTYIDIGQGQPNGIHMYSVTGLVNIKLWDQNGDLFQHYTNSNLWSVANAWRWQQLSWNGTNTVHLLNNGTATQTLTTVVDNAGTMTDTPRTIAIGDRYEGGSPVVNAYLSAFQVWDTSAYFTTTNKIAPYLALNRKDLTKNFGLYNIAGNLQHWWRPGASPSQPGMDYATPATGQIVLTPNYDQIAIVQWGPS